MSTYLIADQNTCENKISTEEEEAFNNKLHEKLDNLLATLPKDKGWRSPNIFLHKDFWVSPASMKGLLMIQNYFQPQPTDIFLAAFMKCGTTWLKAYKMFCNGVSEYGPFWDHVSEYWKASQESPEKILFLKYEDMKREPLVKVKKLASFMGMGFTAEKEEGGVVEDIVKLCSFENLSNLEVNKEGGGAQKVTTEVMVENSNFFRKGKVGDWKGYLTEEMRERIDSITETKLKGSGLTLGLTVKF